MSATPKAPTPTKLATPPKGSASPQGPSRGEGAVPVGVFDPGSGPRTELRVPALVVVAVVGVVGLIVAPALVATVLALVAIITVHELGHFLVARKAGMHTPEFMVGFGPLLWGRRRGETRWGLRGIPLGGYVRITGMSGAEVVVPELEQRAYRSRPARWRIAVSAAGPMANLLFAVLLVFLTVTVVGVRVPVDTPTIGDVSVKSPAADAGFVSGDRVVGVDGAGVRQWDEFVREVKNGDDTLAVTVLRDGQSRTLTVRPVRDGGTRIIGVTQEMETVRRNPVAAAQISVRAVGQFIGLAASSITNLAGNLGDVFGGLVGGKVDPNNRPLSPIGTSQVASSAASQGLGMVLILAALINVLVAVFNLLPVPPLDGGHITVAGIEALLSAIRRRPVRVSPKVLVPISLTMWAVFALLAISALWLDVVDPVQLPR